MLESESKSGEKKNLMISWIIWQIFCPDLAVNVVLFVKRQFSYLKKAVYIVNIKQKK